MYELLALQSHCGLRTWLTSVSLILVKPTSV